MPTMDFAENPCILSSLPQITTLNLGDQRNRITLLPAEHLLRKLLLDCKDNLKEPALELWITGGWVRDRLLGLPCADIDIAISHMTGKQFGDKLTKFINANWGKYEKYAIDLGLPHSRFKGFHTTKKNLKKSKKLETAGGTIFGIDLDLVNLRKEVYEDDSRTPEMAFGTAEEDSLRRDATVNALFYNLTGQEVVDFTGHGLQDLSSQLMRTPLEPQQTFIDDPLRVLRIIRIGSKLGFKIERHTMVAMKEEAIHSALSNKVSRERVGIEILKMMMDSNAHTAFELLFNSDLYETVFLGLDSTISKSLLTYFPKQVDEPWPGPWLEIIHLISNIENTPFRILKKLIQTKFQDAPEQLWTMAAYCPLAGLGVKERKLALQDASAALRMTKTLSKLLDSAISTFTLCQSMVREAIGAARSPSRGYLGLNIRKLGPSWEMQLLFAIFGEVVHAKIQGTNPNQVQTQKVLEQYNRLLGLIRKAELQHDIFSRPILDGNTIKQTLGLRKGGPWLVGALEKVMEWQLDHVGAEVDEAIGWVLENRETLGAPPEDD